MEPHLLLQAWWSKTTTGIATRKTPDDELAALEARYSISIPNEFRKYLKEGLPSVDTWDAEDGNWWPINRLKNIPEEYKYPVNAAALQNIAKRLVFLDYMTWSWAWAISCADDETRGKVALIGGLPDGYVADSFAEFVERYTTDWGSISRVVTAAEPTDRP